METPDKGTLAGVGGSEESIRGSLATNYGPNGGEDGRIEDAAARSQGSEVVREVLETARVAEELAATEEVAAITAGNPEDARILREMRDKMGAYGRERLELPARGTKAYMLMQTYLIKALVWLEIIDVPTYVERLSPGYRHLFATLVFAYRSHNLTTMRRYFGHFRRVTRLLAHKVTAGRVTAHQ